ncbi:unnamed protein product [Rotaria magnacalcarata]|uniref:Uncharacterized protein n=1 Tax=Rotaria magnacalcarata TaxID=392030 RepID=A0A816PR29_9BILA|nr:unnamed protein product [Rotaria magnacalcarata]CAF4368263.1 unnamed protein product [Rotaria magnacalcarata]
MRIKKKHLNRLFYGFHSLTNPDICINSIKDTHVEKIFLIISVTYQSLQYIYICDLPQLEKLYVFDLLSKSNEKETHQNNIFHDINSLAKQLQQDIALCEFDLIYFSASSNPLNYIISSTILTKEEA